MLLVKSIEVVEVDREQVEITYYEKQRARGYCPTEEIEEIESFRREVVQGRRFVNACGREINIGLSSDAEKALGLPFSIFEDMAKSNKELCRVIEVGLDKRLRLQYRLETIKGLSFWERLSRVFVGFSTLSTE